MVATDQGSRPDREPHSSRQGEDRGGRPESLGGDTPFSFSTLVLTVSWDSPYGKWGCTPCEPVDPLTGDVTVTPK